METQKKHIEIHIKMDENEQITPSSKIATPTPPKLWVAILLVRYTLPISLQIAAMVCTMQNRHLVRCSEGLPLFLHTSMKSWKKRRTNPCCNPNLTA